MGTKKPDTISEDDLKAILSTYRLNENGDIINVSEISEQIQEQSQPQSQPQDEVFERTDKAQRVREYLLDIENDIPEHISKSKKYWVQTNKHNQLLNLNRQQIAEIELSTYNMLRNAQSDRSISDDTSHLDDLQVQSLEVRLLSKSDGGFERKLQSTEIVHTVNEDRNLPQAQTNNTSIISRAWDILRRK